MCLLDWLRLFLVCDFYPFHVFVCVSPCNCFACTQLFPEQFSRRMSEELGLSRSFVQPMAQSINRQLLDYGHRLPRWATEGTIAAAAENIHPIDVDVRFRSVIYRDRLHWDVNSIHNSPERFARYTVADLGLPQASKPALIPEVCTAEVCTAVCTAIHVTRSALVFSASSAAELHGRLQCVCTDGMNATALTVVVSSLSRVTAEAKHRVFLRTL